MATKGIQAGASKPLVRISWLGVCVLSCFSHVWFCVTLWTVTHQTPLSIESPGRNIRVGCHALLQGIFPTQESNLHLLSLLHSQLLEDKDLAFFFGISSVVRAVIGNRFRVQTVSHLSCSVVSDSLPLHGRQHARPPCPSPTPGACSDSCPLSRWCHPATSSSVGPFSCLQSFPASGSFLMSQFFAQVAKVLEVQLLLWHPAINSVKMFP